MQITDVRMRKVEKEGKMKAVVSITIDDEFVVHDIKVIEGEKGLFIAMPSRKAGDGDFRDIAHPINSATREQIQGLILKKYEEKWDCGVIHGPFLNYRLFESVIAKLMDGQPQPLLGSHPAVPFVINGQKFK